MRCDYIPEVIEGSQDAQDMCRGVHGGLLPACAAHHKALPQQAAHLAAAYPQLGQPPVCWHTQYRFLHRSCLSCTYSKHELQTRCVPSAWATADPLAHTTPPPACCLSVHITCVKCIPSTSTVHVCQLGQPRVCWHTQHRLLHRNGLSFTYNTCGQST